MADGTGFRREVSRIADQGAAGQEVEVPVTADTAGVYRDLNGRLRDAKGRFVTEGRSLGEGLGDGISEGVGNRLAGLGAILARVGSAIAGVTGVVARGGGFAVLAAGAASAAASMIQLAAAAAPAAGAIAALPGAILLVQAASATLRVALLGVGEAFEAALSGDAAEFEESLENLAPAAQDTARALRALQPEFQALRESVQGAFFAGFDAALTSMASTLLGPVSDGMTQVATEANSLALGLAEVATSSASVDLIGSTFDGLAGIIAEISPGLQQLAEAFIGLAGVGVDAISGLGGGLGSIIERFASFISAAVESGQALSWIENAMTVFSQFGVIASGVGGILASIGQAAQATGGDILGTFGLLIQGVNDFLNTAAGQDFLLSLFEGLGAVGDALLPVLTALGTALAPLLPIVGQIATQLGPGLEALITGLGSGLAELGPSLVPLASAIASVVTAMAPILGVVGQIIGALAGGLAPIVSSLGTAMASIFTAVQPAIDALLPSFLIFIELLSQTLAPILPVIGDLIGSLLPPILELVGVLIDQFMPVFRDMAGQFTELLPLVAELVVALIEALLPVIQALLPPFIELQQAIGAALIDALIAIIPFITFLVQALTPVITLLAEFAGLIIDVVVGAIQLLLGWIQDLLGWITDLWNAGSEGRDKFVQAFKDTGTEIQGFFTDMKDWIDTAVQWWIDLPGRILSAIGDLGSQIWSAITSGIGSLSDVIPGFANGVVTGNRSGLAMLHKQEVVVPLSRPTRAVQLARESGLITLLQKQGALRSGGGNTFNLHFHTPSVSPSVIQRVVERALATTLAEAGG